PAPKKQKVSKKQTSADKDTAFKAKYPDKTDNEILADQLMIWLKNDTSTYKHFDLDRIEILHTSDGVKYKFKCKRMCDGKVAPDNQVITQYSNGCAYDRGAFRLQTVFWMAESSRPFIAIEDRRLRQMFQIVNSKLETELLGTDSVTRDTRDVYRMAVPYVVAKLQSYIGRLHLSFDGWTAVNALSFLGLWVHFLERLKAPHTGQNLGDAGGLCIKFFQIDH
ncbi:hypothetical protein MPER_12971, partial [Moniliophthora perniciosa FA553]